ncbi:hypothetical protein niasHS_002972 [Heterodera schachtii]|uniref:Uncharacterized protein n=2 Tax=Heterodera TaxID=34509 RepID=A0ABD2K9C2_HETSC
MDCSFLIFTRQLPKSWELDYSSSEESDNTEDDEESDNTEDDEESDNTEDESDDIIPDQNTPETGSYQHELELFKEPLWNYLRAIKIDKSECKGRQCYKRVSS